MNVTGNVFLRISAPCPACGEQVLGLCANEAAHDHSLFDLVIECSVDEGGCGRVINAFVPFADFTEVS